MAAINFVFEHLLRVLLKVLIFFCNIVVYSKQIAVNSGTFSTWQ